MCFQYGLDKTSWYWREQTEQIVPGTGERLRLPNPQSADTLPVAAKGGRFDRISAIDFDLIGHGVPARARITRAVLTMDEGTVQNQSVEQPEYNVRGKVIEACPVTSGWARGSAELWSHRPSFKSRGCVKGVRHRALVPRWTFDLSRMAKTWALSPHRNHGVMLVPVIKKTTKNDNNWQVDLKVPDKNSSRTTGLDEYRRTRGRTFVAVTFEKPKPKPRPTPRSTFVPPYVPPGSGGGTNITGTPPIGGVGNPFGPGPSVTGGANPSAPSGPSPSATGNGSGGSESTSTPAVTLTSPRPVPRARFPWYAWVVLPVALLLVAAVRSVIFEQTRAGIRPEGVIASLRKRNGTAPVEPGGGKRGFLRRARSLRAKPDGS
jgi:hypothetical protein